MPIQAVKNKKIGDQVFEQIQDMIINREWTSGEKIPSENEIAQAMSVSRVTVRSALQKLANLGILEIRQGEGTFVCEYSGSTHLRQLAPMLMLTEPDFAAIGEFRFILECNSAKLAARRCTPEILQELKDNFAIYEDLTKRKENNVPVDVDFHMIVAKATQNPYILQTFLILKNHLIRGIEKYQTITGVNPGLYYHKKLIDAIEKRDGDEAFRVMEEHLAVNRVEE